MATFTNQATLSYANRVTNSNIVTGQLLETLSATKTAIRDVYSPGDTVTYSVSIVNTAATGAADVTLQDDLGGYAGTGGATIYPLEYQDGSILYYVNGVPQAAPTVTDTNGLTVSGLRVPAGGNATILYEALVNDFAPPAAGGSITNTVTVSGTGIPAAVTATDTITARSEPQLSITKAMSPTTVSDNDTLTYTFVIQNSGNTAADAADAARITDTLDPILDNISVSFNGTPWTLNTQYTYNEATGEFATTAGQILVPEASYTQDPTTGLWTLTPGVATLVVSGTV